VIDTKRTRNAVDHSSLRLRDMISRVGADRKFRVVTTSGHKATRVTSIDALSPASTGIGLSRVHPSTV
jgi:hypothetical protein